MGYVDFLVDSIVSMLEDLTHDIWNKEAGRSQLANMTSFKWKPAQSSAIWRIQYHKNLTTDETCQGSEQLPIAAVTLRGLAINSSISLL